MALQIQINHSCQAKNKTMFKSGKYIFVIVIVVNCMCNVKSPATLSLPQAVTQLPEKRSSQQHMHVTQK